MPAPRDHVDRTVPRYLLRSFLSQPFEFSFVLGVFGFGLLGGGFSLFWSFIGGVGVFFFFCVLAAPCLLSFRESRIVGQGLRDKGTLVVKISVDPGLDVWSIKGPSHGDF